MPHLPCMPTLVRVGITGGAVDTFMADGRSLLQGREGLEASASLT